MESSQLVVGLGGADYLGFLCFNDWIFGVGVHFAFDTIIYYFFGVGKGKRKTADYYTAVSLSQFIYLLSSPLIQSFCDDVPDISDQPH